MTDSVGLPPETVAVDLTRHERGIILEAMESQVRNTTLISKRIGGPGIYVTCWECYAEADCRHDVKHVEGCYAAGVWALHDRLSKEWAADV